MKTIHSYLVESRKFINEAHWSFLFGIVRFILVKEKAAAVVHHWRRAHELGRQAATTALVLVLLWSGTVVPAITFNLANGR